jgi:hypothetical protein
MNLTREEQETVIIWNNAESTASIDTCDAKLIRRLEKIVAENQQCLLLREDTHGKVYKIPKVWVKVRTPRQLSEELRSKMIQMAKDNLHAKKDL